MASTYQILSPIPSESDECWSVVPELLSTAAKNLAGTACIIKWQGTKPACLPAGTEYTEAGIKQYVIDNIIDWSAQLGDPF
jgi:hypothetical protein